MQTSMHAEKCKHQCMRRNTNINARGEMQTIKARARARGEMQTIKARARARGEM